MSHTKDLNDYRKHVVISIILNVDISMLQIRTETFQTLNIFLI